MKRIVDCFTFFNELDLLEIRLEEEYALVDEFVICESRQTFQGHPKPLYFDENRGRFEKYLPKITHLVIDQFPDTDNVWAREHYQRNYLRNGFLGADPNDIIIITDADEIISRNTLKILRHITGFIQLDMPMFQYYLNLQAQPSGWTKPFAFSRYLLDEIPDFNIPRTNQDEVFAAFGNRAVKVDEAGWHFTYLGGADQIRTKLNAFSHTDGWHEYMRTPGAVERHIQIGYVVGNFWHLAKYVPIDCTYPNFIINNQKLLENKNYIRNVYDALTAIQVAFREFDHLIKTEHQALAKERATYRDILVKFGIKPFSEEAEFLSKL
ncbi:MAG TPA: hypothetical protein PK677_14125 [Acidiphilium sp.]|uniref:hypothetical protein n=1 Tax=Acidiphilium sp. TaxID=527 RepID=UPI000BCC1A94|nr:hypothetical protein [Acidiphilium sp.]OYV89236.1 MAG: hypothetical protein B7Z57_13325 [Acidiphilium sp. 37-60-79]OZB38500.1 MAG: hypothetical protein B7X48_12950 [Acidiphilium sp. 34-60-192]HQT89664.1 hypothetical protein [Acidiphilium sp.]